MSVQYLIISERNRPSSQCKEKIVDFIMTRCFSRLFHIIVRKKRPQPPRTEYQHLHNETTHFSSLFPLIFPAAAFPLLSLKKGLNSSTQRWNRKNCQTCFCRVLAKVHTRRRTFYARLRIPPTRQAAAAPSCQCQPHTARVGVSEHIKDF